MATNTVRTTPTDHDPEALVWARKAKRWRQTQLAKAADVSPSLLCHIEAGRRNATPDVLDRLAQALNCPVSLLERKRVQDAA